MFSKCMTTIIVAGACLGALFAGGCRSDAGTGAVIGGLAGAGVGQLAGGHTEATLIGAAVGTAAGYMIGNESDKQKAQHEAAAIRQEMHTVLVNVHNSNGSIIQVPLKKYGVGYLGTRGEYYPTMPTEEQLRVVYGF